MRLVYTYFKNHGSRHFCSDGSRKEARPGPANSWSISRIPGELPSLCSTSFNRQAYLHLLKRSVICSNNDTLDQFADSYVTSVFRPCNRWSRLSQTPLNYYFSDDFDILAEKHQQSHLRPQWMIWQKHFLRPSLA